MPTDKEANKVKKIHNKPKKAAPQSSIQVDERAVQKLADILNHTNLSEIEYETDAGRIRVAKYAPAHPSLSALAPAVAPPPVPLDNTSVAQAPPVAPSSSHEGVSHDQSTHPGAIKAPMVGTIYLSPQPDAPPFVKVGDKVKEGDTLLIIEAMKVMNPIRSHKAGTVKEVLVSSGEPVEFDHPLLILE